MKYHVENVRKVLPRKVPKPSIDSDDEECAYEEMSALPKTSVVKPIPRNIPIPRVQAPIKQHALPGTYCNVFHHFIIQLLTVATLLSDSLACNFLMDVG